MSSLAVLQRYVRRSKPEVCELCAAPLHAAHRHLLSLDERRLLCACTGCALGHSDAGPRRYRTVPTRVVRSRQQITASEWAAIGIPVGLAFIFYSSTARRPFVIMPSPAGATEAELPDAAWNTLKGRLEIAALLEPDVEALLVRLERGASSQSFVVPIDRCYAFAGQIRSSWKGIDGGDEARAVVREFIRALDADSEQGDQVA